MSSQHRTAEDPSDEVQDLGVSFRPLPPEALTVDLWAGAITFVSLMAGASVGLLVAILFAGPPVTWILGLVWPFLASLLGFQCFYWPRVSHRHVSYRADERGLQIRRGVFWRSYLSVARSRIQHTDVAQGPLQRRLGLARLVVHTAGTHNASTSLSGIPHDEALRIRELLTAETSTGRSASVSDGV